MSSFWKSKTQIGSRRERSSGHTHAHERTHTFTWTHAHTHTHTHLKAIKIDCQWLSRYVKSISDRAAWGCLCQFSLTAVELRWHVSAVSELQYTLIRTHTLGCVQASLAVPLPSFLRLRSPARVPQWTKMWYSQRNGLPQAKTTHIVSISAQTGTETTHTTWITSAIPVARWAVQSILVNLSNSGLGSRARVLHRVCIVFIKHRIWPFAVSQTSHLADVVQMCDVW